MPSVCSVCELTTLCGLCLKIPEAPPHDQLQDMWCGCDPDAPDFEIPEVCCLLSSKAPIWATKKTSVEDCVTTNP